MKCTIDEVVKIHNPNSNTEPIIGRVYCITDAFISSDRFLWIDFFNRNRKDRLVGGVYLESTAEVLTVRL